MKDRSRKGRELIGVDLTPPDGLIFKWMKRGFATKTGVLRGLHRNGSWRLDLDHRKRIRMALQNPPPKPPVTRWGRVVAWVRRWPF